MNLFEVSSINWKKLLRRLLPWFIVLALLTTLVLVVGTALYGPKDVSTHVNPTVHFYEGDTKKPLILENDNLLFKLDPATTHFSVTDKKSGMEWLSNPENADKDPLAKTAANKETMQSTFVVTYTTSGGNADFNNFKYSIENGNYTITPLDDGSLRVDYAVGKIEKTYLMPTVITKERYDTFVGNMKKATAKKVASNYSLYEPSKLDSKKNKDEIIALYPEVLNQPLYILKEGTSDSNKKKIEGYFEEGNYTQEDYEIDQQLIAGKKDVDAPVFNVTMIYRLEGNDLVVEVPYREIQYRQSYPITYLTVLPMFGAADTKTDGAMLIPEGGGALIRYNNGKTTQNPYYADVYGWDYAIARQTLISETRNSFPVYGMLRENASFLCLMEGAASYAGIQADISQRNNSYNWLCAKYRVLHNDQYNVSAKTAQLVFMFEKEIPREDSIIHRYRFFNTGDYVTLARAYGDYLLEAHPEMAQKSASADMPVTVEMIGAIDKTVVKAGLPVESVVSTTSFAQAENIMSDLVDAGVKNLQVSMSGWANGGILQKAMTAVRVNREMGGLDGMKKLIAAAKEKDVPLYFDGISCFAYESGIAEGFIAFNDAARYTTREQVYLQPFDAVTYREAEWMENEYYLVKPSFAQRCTDNFLNYLEKQEAEGVAFRDIGYLLSGDYNPKDLVTRERVKKMNVQSMKDAHAAGQRVMIHVGNDYAVPYADIIVDMDLTGTRYSLIDQNIPFYQIALHGLKDYTGKSLTTVGDMVQELLRCVEYGSGLNFTFVAEDTQILQNTYHSLYFGSFYDARCAQAKEIVLRYQKEMEGLNRQRICAHAQLSDTLTMTGYDDGTKVYVNFGKHEAEYNGIVIPGYDYIVERGK